MATPLIQHLALISESNRVDLSELVQVSAALQKQVMRDVSPVWGVNATVDAFARLEDMPLGTWPMIVMDNLPFPAAGIHLDQDGQPFALITASDDNDVWSLTASHECLEMLVDPFGDRLVPGDSPKREQDRVLFLVEVCDPSEAANFGYSVNGSLVSDFYTQQYFDPVVSNGVRYSFTDAISEPRQVLPGGYLSWLDPSTGHWWQETWFSGPQSRFVDLGPLSAANGSFRSQLDRQTTEYRLQAIGAGRQVASAAGLTAAVIHNSSNAKAQSLRHQIDGIVGRATSPVTVETNGPQLTPATDGQRRSARRVVRST